MNKSSNSKSTRAQAGSFRQEPSSLRSHCRPEAEANCSGWSLRNVRNYLLSLNNGGGLNDEQAATVNRSHGDRISAGDRNAVVGRPEEREAWRFADTVYEAALTQVS